MTKYTNLDLQSFEEQFILLDRFLSQATPDIMRKLQKLVREQDTTLEEIPFSSNCLFQQGPGRRGQGSAEGEKRKERRQTPLLVVLQGQTHSKNAQPHPEEGIRKMPALPEYWPLKVRMS